MCRVDWMSRCRGCVVEDKEDAARKRGAGNGWMSLMLAWMCGTSHGLSVL